MNNPPSTMPDPRPLLERLNRVAKKEDPDRPTVQATCCEGNKMPGLPVVSDLTDAVGANRYPGWRWARSWMLSTRFAPPQPLAVSEYGAGGAFSVHTDDPRGGPVETAGRIQPEEHQAWVHEQAWPQLKARPYLWATWLWNSFDFSTYTRTEGDSREINTKGLVSYDGQTRKDVWYFYKANWSDSPTVRITGRRYTDRAYPVTDVRVYSNADETALILNGQSLGTQRDCPNRICVWTEVRLAAGRNTFAASGFSAAGDADDSVEWTLSPAAALAFRIDAGALTAAPAQGRRFGSDAFFTGGNAGTTDRRANGRAPLNQPAIRGTTDRALVASFREGAFSYRIPAAPGRYRVTLTFVEPGAAPGERLFNVMAGGRTAISALDLAAVAGPLTAVTRSFETSADIKSLALEFVPLKGKAIVSGIEIEPL